MAIQFGVGTLTVLENRPLDIVIGDLSASSSTLTATNNRSIMIDGITAIWSAQVLSLTAIMGTGAGQTGSGLLLFAHLSGNTTTSIAGMLSAAHHLNTATNIPTAMAPIAKFSFGTGANTISTLVMVSGGSATKTIARVQNVSLNMSVEVSQMRGGGDVYPVDTQHFDGKCEGSFEFSEQTATQLQMFGGVYASAGASSGTWTLSATSKPNPVSLVFQNVTNGITGTYRVMRAYLNSASNEFSRTDYMNPSYAFITQANVQGTVLTMEQ